MVALIEQQLKTFSFSPLLAATVYLVLIGMAEVITTFSDATLGLVFHGAILVALLVHSARTWDQPEYRFLLPLTLAPLIRLLSLSLPLNSFPIIWWYFIISVPIFAAAFVIIRTIPIRISEIGFRVKRLPLELIVSATGVFFGFCEYQILQSQPLIADMTPEHLIVPSLILFFSTGFMEELVFRGIMLQSGKNILGRWNLVFVSSIFMVLHIGYKSLLDLIFVFSVGYFWGWIKSKTGSVLGITISHSITNIMLFLILPFLSTLYLPTVGNQPITNTNTTAPSIIVAPPQTTAVATVDNNTSSPLAESLPRILLTLYCTFVGFLFIKGSNKARSVPRKPGEQTQNKTLDRRQSVDRDFLNRPVDSDSTG